MRSLFVYIFLATALAAFTYPKELKLPVFYYDYKEYGATADVITGIAGIDLTADELSFIKTYSYRFNEDNVYLDNHLKAAAACDFDICQINSLKGDSYDKHQKYCPGWEHGDGRLGVVDGVLTVDGVPKLKREDGKRVDNKNTRALDYWYRNHTMNRGVIVNITLNKLQETSSLPIYRYNNNENFHPLKNIVGTFYCPYAGFKTCNHRNYVFGTHFKARILFNSKDESALKMRISSDDDSFLFVDKKLVHDFGGTRPNTEIDVRLDKPGLNFKHGETYQVDFFHADRCSSASSFTVQGSFTCETFEGSNVDTDKDGVPDCADRCPDNPDKYKETIDCGCGIDCLKCEQISPLMCSKHLDMCDQCTVNGPCVTKGSCTCEEITKQADCDSYVPTTGSACKWCMNSGLNIASCVPKTRCECASYSEFIDCKNADSGSYDCRWCSGKCINYKDRIESEKYCTCTDENITEENCKDIYNSDFIVKSCGWCTFDGGGYCDTTCDCSKFSDIADEDKCTSLWKDTGSNSVTLCKICEPGNGLHFCIKKDEYCGSCYDKTNLNDCNNSSYTAGSGTSQSCKWCGGKCIASSSCPACTAYTDPNECKNAIGTNGAKLNCEYCSDGVCKAQNECPTCSQISANLNIGEMAEQCTKSIHHICHFCGSLEIEDSGVPLCVSDVTQCPPCATIPTLSPKTDFNFEMNCEALRFVYSQTVKPLPGDHGFQRCAYCDYTGKCIDLGSKIGEYAAISEPADKDKYAFKEFCDTNCHNYDFNKDGCKASALNCAWCELPNGTSTCNGPKEECAVCSEYTSDFLCLGSDCTWCKETKECISNNFKCPSPSAVAAGIGAGVIAAIIIAAIVALVLASIASKKMYDAIMDARAASMDTATSNPLFEENAAGGVNPAFEAN